MQTAAESATLQAKESRFGAWIDAALEKALKESFIRRLWEKDPSLWNGRPGQKDLADRLGWLDAPQKSADICREAAAFAEELRAEKVTHAVLMGMGGSSLAPEVFQNVFGSRPGFLRLVVLDSTDPERVLDAAKTVRGKKSVFIFASKSGTTTEPFSFYKYFYALVSKSAGGTSAGNSFIAITDPGTSLEALAKEKGFRRVFLADPEVGGRYSALTAFGLVPAALIGVDVKKVLSKAAAFAQKTRQVSNPQLHPALKLGAAMAVFAGKGRDKLTLTSSAGLESFADWAEQLIAESTGKQGKGVIPVVKEKLSAPSEYGSDRFFAQLALGKDPASDAKLARLSAGGHPVFTIRLDEKADLGAEFFRWEMATAIAGAFLGINPFDQPDVQSAKDKTKALLKFVEEGKEISVDARTVKGLPFKIACSAALGKDPAAAWQKFWPQLKNGSALHVLAFLPPRKPIEAQFQKLRQDVRRMALAATTLGFGPRYLHSTGQLHKGGPDNAVFLVVTARRKTRVPVPGDKFTFEQLQFAQAVGDFQALDAKKRRALFIELKDFSAASLKALAAASLKALGRARV